MPSKQKVKPKFEKIEIGAIQILGWDQYNNKINLSDCLSDMADQELSQDIEEFIAGVNAKKNGKYDMDKFGCGEQDEFDDDEDEDEDDEA